MARPRKAKQQEEENIKEVAKEVARQAILEYNQQDDEGPDEDTISFIDAASDISEAKSSPTDPTGFDIFTDIGDPRTEKGDIIRYVIRKWGQHISTKYHPYSWEELHKEFGSGNYQVLARSDTTKKFVKSESRVMGEARQMPQKEETTSHAEMKSGPAGLNFLEYWQLIQDQQRQAKEEAREMAKENSNTQNQMLMMVAELMRANSSSGSSSSVQMMQMITQMIQSQQDNTNRIFEKLAENQTKMFEKINDRIEKIQDKKSSEFEMFNKGIEMFSKMNELAEKRVQLQLEQIEDAKEDARENSNSEPKKKSLTDSLIEGILPVVSQALVKPQTQYVTQLPHASQRRALPPNSKPVVANRTVQRGGGNQATGNATKNAKTTTESQATSKINGETGGASTGNDFVKRNGFPSAVVESSAPDIIDFSYEDEKELKDIKSLSVKDKCKEILPEFLGHLMLNETEVGEASGQLVEYLSAHNISREEFLKEVTVDDLLGPAKEYGLPVEALKWLNELYAYLSGTPRNDVRGKSRSSSQPEATLELAGQP